MQLALVLIQWAYYLYLLDPFTSKVKQRNYKRLLTDKSYFKTHLFCSTLFATAFLTIAWLKKGNYSVLSSMCLAPLAFIILTKYLNTYSTKKYNRDFYLVLRGDTYKYSTFDIVARLTLLILPWVISLVTIVYLSRSLE